MARKGPSAAWARHYAERFKRNEARAMARAVREEPQFQPRATASAKLYRRHRKHKQMEDI